jgi:PAS domain S-box-containing protein
MSGRLPRIQGRRIFLKFASVSLLTMALIGLGMTAVVFVSQKQAYEEEVKSRWLEIARISGGSLENALLVDDCTFLQGMTTILGKESDITRCRVFNKRGMVLSPDGFSDAETDHLVARCLVEGEPILEEYASLWEGPGYVEIAQPINLEDEVWGVVRISCSLERLENLTRSLYTRLVLLAVVCGALALLGSLLMAKHMAGPVVRLARLAHDVAGGNLDVKCALRRRDELGNLADSFDQMVTNLRLARVDLEGASQYMESILESMVDSVLVIEHPPVDAATGPRIKTANRATVNLLGFREKELVGQPLDRILGSRKRRENILSRVLATGTVRNLEVHYLAKTGERRHMRLSVAAMTDSGPRQESGPEEITAFVFVASDITELKRSERVRMATHLMSDSASRCESLPDLYRAVHEVIVSLVPTDRFQIGLMQSGKRVVELAYDSQDEITLPEAASLARYVTLIGKPLHLTAPTILELTGQDVISFDGEAPVECLGIPMRIGDRLIGVMTVQSRREDRRYRGPDIDLLAMLADQIAVAVERKRAEEERLRLSLAVEQAVDGSIITDTRGIIQYVNPAFTGICGFSREEAIGDNTFFLWSGGHDRRAFVELWRGVAEGKDWSGRMSNRRKDGSAYEVEVTVSQVRSASGDVVNYVAVCHDVTNERALESQLRQAQKMEAVGKLAGGIAHDFNNLLSVITGYTSLYLEDQPKDAPGLDVLEEVRRAGDRAASLTRQLLAFSRRQVLKPQILNLNAVIEDLQRMLRRLIGEDITLETDFDPALGSVEVDPGQVEQVVMNLAVNARDAMPGGGKLTIETRNVVLESRGLDQECEVAPGPYALLAVSDTGHGMDDETLSRVFEPFFTTKETGKGTGLGLSTVYGIVKQSDGHITAYSEMGCGTSFKVYFPRLAASVKSSEVPEVEDPEAMKGTETILLVEDETGVRNMARDLLLRRGYRVLLAENGREALEVSKSFPERIDLVLTDVIMPEMSGHHLVPKLLESRPETKVIYMSGYTDAAIARHGILDSGSEFIEKPFQLDELLRRIRATLSGEAGPSRNVRASEE